MTFKPLLAGEAPEILKYPLLASPKLDGVRGIVFGDSCLSRSLKKIPNGFVQKYFRENDLDGLDGELIVGEPNASDVFRVTTSGVMSEDGEPDFSFFIFDDIRIPSIPFKERFKQVQERKITGGRVIVLPQILIQNENELIEYEKSVLTLGYEGLILRSLDGRYKNGRSTTKEGIMLKLKRFSDSEALVVGFEEEMRNDNTAQTNELGETERSSHKENLVPKGTLGALVVKDVETGIQFNIGTGFDAATRKWIWDNRNKVLGQIHKYKYFKVGVKDLPRHPVWLGARDPRDMS